MLRRYLFRRCEQLDSAEDTAKEDGTRSKLSDQSGYRRRSRLVIGRDEKHPLLRLQMRRKHHFEWNRVECFYDASGRRQPGHATATASLPVDAERVEAAANRLASYIGPIARIIARRATRGADEASLHARLAEALPASVDKKSFLRSLGNPVA